MPRRLLLISKSINHGHGYLDHVLSEIYDFLGSVRTLVFVPFAQKDLKAYGGRAAARMKDIGVEATTLTADEAGRELLRSCEAVFTGGGNTFRLLKILQDAGLLPILRERARAGMPYLGSSAGTNLACPTIRTTNDMPIVQPASFDAMGLIPFQINPHYIDPDPGSTHMGETREQRLKEFHEENSVPVVGLREGAWIRVEEGTAILRGANGARVFRQGQPAEERAAGGDVSDLL
ncbi:MAG TPA: dipeptidase PepE [Thermoanaerobaculia bacterium]|nr:dipeptidase PepE [Thermoanaerobaculia bacterium]